VSILQTLIAMYFGGAFASGLWCLGALKDHPESSDNHTISMVMFTVFWPFALYLVNRGEE
jgi:hypothetical protein